MSDYNRVILCGRLGRDAELRYTPGGAAVSNFNMATTEVWKDRDGNKKEQTEWSTIVVWGKTAEALQDYLTKGKQVLVEGKIQTRKWEKDGVTHYKTEVKADRIVLLGSKSDGGRGGHVSDESVGAEMGQAAEPSDAAQLNDDDIPF